MIENVSRIVEGRAIDAPAIFEAPIMGRNFVETLWMQTRIVEHPAGTLVQIAHVDSGEYIMVRPDEVLSWLQPEDMNSPALQAEIITALASKGFDL